MLMNVFFFILGQETWRGTKEQRNKRRGGGWKLSFLFHFPFHLGYNIGFFNVSKDLFFVPLNGQFSVFGAMYLPLFLLRGFGETLVHNISSVYVYSVLSFTIPSNL